MKLVIVESPAKAKTIEKFLGPDYKVVASYGHIRDLPSSAKEVPARFRDRSWARLAVDTDSDFKPLYVVPRDSQARVRELKKMVGKADELLLATDEDREGESISWHLLQVLDPDIPVRRITFHEITRSAIARALEQPRDVDRRLVKAQEARRVLDRLFGYELSPVLWKKVRTKLSAGRVQSAALRLIVEREEERQAFKTSRFWGVEAELEADAAPFKARLVSIGSSRVATSRDFDSVTGAFNRDSGALILDQEQAEAIVAGAKTGIPWTVSSVERKEGRQRPAPPFTTSTLQQAASSSLRMSPKQTMRVAQTLYEGIDLGEGEREGLITYMRTDSVTLSAEALATAERYITKTFGAEFHQGPRRYQTKARAAQEAHEAIRPTDMARTPESVTRLLSKEELAVYRLIWRRAVASQMADAQVDRTTVEMVAEVGDEVATFRATGSVLRFPGFLEVMGRTREDSLLPALREGQPVGDEDSGVPVTRIEAEGHETRPPPRYTEASLVKKLEEEGIGRPSTYTPTISTIQDRQYAVKKGSALVPTYVGMAVLHLLREHFSHYVDLKFTAKMEDTLDDIAAGQIDPKDFLASFYRGGADGETGLVNAIEAEMPRIEYPAIPIGRDAETDQPIFVRIGRNHVYVQRGVGDDGDRATLPVDLLIDELTPERAAELLELRERSEEPLGRDPESGLNIYAKVGPYGPYLQLGESDNGEKPKRVSLPRGVEPESVTLEYAIRMLSLPRSLGIDPETGSEVTAGLGRYGPYVARDKTYRNVGSVDRLFEIQLDEAIELINQKAKRGKTVLRALGAHPESGDPIELLEGRYGPYVSDGSVNASLPRGSDPDAVTLEEAVRMLAEAATRKESSPKKKRAKRSRK